MESSGLGELFDYTTSHLKRKHLDFLKKWDNMLSLELAELDRIRVQIFSMDSEDREKLKL